LLRITEKMIQQNRVQPAGSNRKEKLKNEKEEVGSGGF